MIWFIFQVFCKRFYTEKKNPQKVLAFCGLILINYSPNIFSGSYLLYASLFFSKL